MSTGKPDYRKRLTDFYAKHAPEKGEQDIDKALETWKGREEEMFAALKHKYKVASASASPAAPTGNAAQVKTDYRSQLTALFQKHDPKRLSEVDHLLGLWGGREDQLIVNIEREYTSKSAESYRARLVAFYEKQDPSKVASVDRALETWKGREEEMFRALESKYASKEAAAASGIDPKNYRERLKLFYKRNAPEKTDADVDKALETWKGKEEQMFAALEKKYATKKDGSEASPPAASAPTPTANPSASGTGATTEGNYRQRLLDFYARLNPNKVPKDADIDKALTTWKGREEEMFAALEKKYANASPKSAQSPGANPPASSTPNQRASSPSSPRQGAGNTGYQERLKAFYAKHAPEKTSADVEKALATWAGREEEMFAALEKKYAVKKDDASDVPKPSPYMDRLMAFYSRYAPIKTKEDAEKALQVWKGREEEMFTALEKKYSCPGGSQLSALRATNNQASYRARLIGFYEQYAPEKLADVDKALETWKGREEDMFVALEKKYNVNGSSPQGSPDASPRNLHDPSQDASKSGTPAGVAADDDPNRVKLRAFYRQHAPEKTEADITKALDTWKGRENEMFATLEKKYGVAPSKAPTPTPLSGSPSSSPIGSGGDRSARSRLEAFYKQYAPEKTADDVEKALATWKGREEEMFAALAKKYDMSQETNSTSPSGKNATRALSPSSAEASNLPKLKDNRTTRERLAAFFYHRAPDKMNDIDSTIEMWKGREEDMFAALVVKYGPEPPLGTFAPEVSPEKVQRQTMRQRLEEFYQVREMDMDIDIDKALTMWKGREEEMFKSLEKKYGPPKVTLERHMSKADAREKLVELYREFAPEKLPTVDRTLELWKGREGEMVRTLTKKYRDAEVNAAEQDNVANTELYVQRITAMYCRYLPERLSELTAVLDAHEGQEAALLESMCVRFGPEPDPYDFQSRLERVYGFYEPGRVKEARSLAQQASGREDFVIRTLVKKYGPEPGAKYSVPPTSVIATNPRDDRHRIRLTRWFMLKCPRRAPEVDYYLVRFAGRESLLFRLMAETLGPEPKDEPLQETVRSRFLTTPALKAYFEKRRAPPFLNWLWNGTVEGAEQQTTKKPAALASTSTLMRDRLTRFYQHYHPIKVSEVDETLARWRGREELLFEALVHKYGAEPPNELPSRLEPSNVSPRGQSRTVPPGLAGGQSPHLATTPRAILQSFYAVQNPSKLKDIEATLERFHGREEVMYHMLHTKYGVNPLMMPSSRGRSPAAGDEMASPTQSSPLPLSFTPGKDHSPSTSIPMRRPPSFL